MAARLVEYVPQGRSYEQREAVIETKEALTDALRRLASGEPAFVDVLHEDQDVLTIGIGGPQACVMYVRPGADPPYLWATRLAGEHEPDVEFDASGTPTPVSASRLIPPDRAIAIAAYFFDTGFIPEPDDWESD